MTRERLFVRLPGDGLDAPETSVPASTLEEIAVDAALGRWTSPVLAYRETFAPGQSMTERVLPDGATRLIVHLGDGGPRALVIGASIAPAVLTMRGKQHGLSMALRPGAVGALFDGLPASALAHEAVPLETLWPEHRALAHRLVEADDDRGRARLLATVLRARLGTSPAGHVMAARAAVLVDRSGGRRSVRSIAAEIGVSERRLQQLFAAHLGLTPRGWGRLCRMNACLRLLRGPRRGWAGVAADAGYYDQSHLVNELRALSGLTPTDLLALVSGSSKPESTAPG